MVEFTDTIQCPLCGSTYSSKKGHACSKLNQNATWASTGKGFWGSPQKEPVMDIVETLHCILEELRQIHQMLERGAR